MHRPLPLIAMLLGALSAALPSFNTRSAVAQEGDETAYRLLQRTYRSKAGELQFELAATSTKLVVADEPVLTWTSLGGWSGDVFVWTGQGRIQIVGCIGSQKLDDDKYQLFNEFTSLLDEPMKDAELGDKYVWRPAESNRWAVLTDAPAPSPSKALRLVQMRRLASSFSFGMRIDDETVENELRLLPQPVARESRETGEVKDSALFAFVSSSGTDPEIFLLLEARVIDGQPRWTYSVARLTTRAIWYSRSGGSVTQIDATGDIDWAKREIEDSYFYRNDEIVSLSRRQPDTKP